MKGVSVTSCMYSCWPACRPSWASAWAFGCNGQELAGFVAQL